MKRYFSVLLILFSLLVWVAPVHAATVPAGFNIWTTKTTTNTLKDWTVTFSAPMDINSVNSSNLYVTDDSNKLVKTTLIRSADGASVQIHPVSAYVVGKKYWVYVTEGVTVNNGKQHLTKQEAMPFMVVKDSVISSVSNSYSSLLTSFTVVTSPEVCSVKIKQSQMLYQGNNIYKLGMTGLKLGSKVTVYAYDGKGKLLESEIYTIN